jgi:hypothetical protein
MSELVSKADMLLRPQNDTHDWRRVKRVREAFGLYASAMGNGYSRANTAARIRRLAVGLALILVAIGLPRSPA